MEELLVFFLKKMIQRTEVAIDKDITLTTLLLYQGENYGINKTLGASFGHKLATF
jgi:hypothetical protein